MIHGRASRKGLAIAAVAGAIGAMTMAAPAASAAEAFPTCEVMLGQETCDEYYYGPLGTVGQVVVPLWVTLYETTDTATETVIWGSRQIDCVVWGRCS